MNGLFITGTNTAVGKTTITCNIIKGLQKNGIIVKVRKPVETDCNPKPKDATILANLTKEDINIVCAYQYKQCSSPEQADKNLQLNDLVLASKKNIFKDDFVIVEGAGGFYSPIAKNALNADLTEELKLDIILIVKDELGCLSQTLLTIEAIKNRNLKLKMVVFNTFEKNDLDNINALKRFTDVLVVNAEELLIFNKDFWL